MKDPALDPLPLVLVADDDPALRLLFQRALERRGFKVVLAANGREALELLETHDISVCLFDLNMPNLDGLGTLREIRADDRYRAIPVILVTGSDAESATLRARGDGANDWISKPVGLDELAASVWAQLPPPH